MNTACPTDDRLKQLISESFDEIPGPESVRLERIAARLGQQIPARLRPRSYWLIWLLLGGSMTAAAWWGGQHWFRVESTPVVTPTENRIPEISTSPVTQSPVASESLLTKPDTANTQPSPIIDQREQY